MSVTSNPNYYNADKIVIFPSSNATDIGKVNAEENLTEIVTRMRVRNYKLSDDDFELTLDDNKIVVSSGMANISGYLIKINDDLTVTNYPDVDGNYYVCILTYYDNSDHIKGDLIDGATTLNEGACIVLTDDLELYGKKLLVLGTTEIESGIPTSVHTESVYNTSPYSSDDVFLEHITATCGDTQSTADNGDQETLTEFMDNLPSRYVSKKYNDTKHGYLKLADSNDDVSIEIIPESQSVDGGLISINDVSNNDTLTITEGHVLDSGDLEVLGSDNVEIQSNFDSSTSTFSNSIFMDDTGITIETDEDLNAFYTDSNKSATIGHENVSTFNVADTKQEMTIGQNHPVSVTSTVVTLNDNLTFSRTDNTIDTKDRTAINIIPTVSLNDLDIKQNGQLKVNGTTASKDIIISESTGVQIGNHASLGYSDWIVQNKIVATRSYSEYKTNANTPDSTTLLNNTISLNSKNANANTISFKTAGTTKASISNPYNSTALDVTSSLVTVSGDLTANRVFNAVYNDYAELYKKDPDEEINPGDVIVLKSNGLYGKSDMLYDRCVVGVCSDSYGHLLGGDENATLDENLKNYIPVGLCGRVYVNVDKNDMIKPGDLMCSSNRGLATKSDRTHILGTIIGKALSTNEDGKVLMQIMLQ